MPGPRLRQHAQQAETRGVIAVAAATRAASTAPILAERSTNPSSEMIRSVSGAAQQVSGFFSRV
jgi:hypothetical protein